MITLDSASGNLQIPKIFDYQLLMDNIKRILNIDDEFFKYLYFSYIDEHEQERIRLNPQIFDDFISQESPILSIGFLENIDENTMEQFKEIIDLNKKRFKEIGYKISEEDLYLNDKIIINEDNIPKNEGENEIQIENDIILEKENDSKEKEIEREMENNIISENEKDNKENEIQIETDIILEKEKDIKENEIEREMENNIISENEKDNKENEIQIENEKDNKEKEIQIKEDNIIILEKENINNNNSNEINNAINNKVLDNFNLFDSDNIKKINTDSCDFLKNTSNNKLIKGDSIDFAKINSSELNLIKFDKNDSLNLEEKKEIEQDEFSKNIENIITSNVENIKDDIIHSILSENSIIQQKSKSIKNIPNNNYVHKNYECDYCKAYPIKGVRYHCLECVDFDICEKCEQELNHQHPLYKIKRDKFCKFKNEKLN